MRLFTRRTLREFWDRHPDAREQLRIWASVIERAKWSNPMDVKAIYGKADILKSGRVVFDVCGNKYRLVVVIRYADEDRNGAVLVRFLGTHAQYDRIDADDV